MNEQETRDEARIDLRGLFLDHPSATMPSLIEFSSAVPEDVQDVDAFIDRILAAGYRRGPR